LYIKRIHPETKIIGVNTIDSDSMFQSLVNGHVTTIDTAGLFSDGTSVRQVGDETYRVCASFVDDWIHVSTDEICAAIRDVYSETRTVLEVCDFSLLVAKWSFGCRGC
jgi:threonine dehydratase